MEGAILIASWNKEKIAKEIMVKASPTVSAKHKIGIAWEPL